MVEALNKINANVWSILLIVFGVVLASFDPASTIASALITGAFAIFQQRARAEAPVAAGEKQ